MSSVATSGDYSNATLTYTTNGSTATTFLTRCNGLGYGFDVIAMESHGPHNRAFYPRQRALSPFLLTLQLNGYRDYKAFMDFLKGYMANLQATNTHAMAVSIPARNFYRFGVPIEGMSDGDHIGSMVFTPTIVFQAIYDPLDPQIFTTANDASQVDLGGSQADNAATFFYPVTASTNDPNATGESLYDVAPTPPTPYVYIPPPGSRPGPK